MTYKEIAQKHLPMLRTSETLTNDGVYYVSCNCMIGLCLGYEKGKLDKTEEEACKSLINTIINLGEKLDELTEEIERAALGRN